MIRHTLDNAIYEGLDKELRLVQPPPKLKRP